MAFDKQPAERRPRARGPSANRGRLGRAGGAGESGGGCTASVIVILSNLRIFDGQDRAVLRGRQHVPRARGAALPKVRRLTETAADRAAFL